MLNIYLFIEKCKKKKWKENYYYKTIQFIFLATEISLGWITKMTKTKIYQLILYI